MLYFLAIVEGGQKIADKAVGIVFGILHIAIDRLTRDAHVVALAVQGIKMGVEHTVARIERHEDDYEVVDGGSQNGTSVNGSFVDPDATAAFHLIQPQKMKHSFPRRRTDVVRTADRVTPTGEETLAPDKTHFVGTLCGLVWLGRNGNG